MSIRTRAFLETYGIPLAICLCFGFLALHATPAYATDSVDLADGVTTATKSFQKIISVVFGIAALVIVVGGLVVSAFKFTQRDAHAMHYLVGTIAAGVICGIVSGLL